ncbi:MAG: Holliday junction resolvase RuvX [Chloroflexi bacterium]|jgi:putative holliday junction resolvase|nr:Holliday junction resolvase RuvX [Chloroflexota bacterium]MBT4515547.1 Holliday junction resolvase RuvX [Chloroflexota bacterium]MBT6680850.1 Holliday junction resolvase RuvX [Chloroflexota bacterium]
MRALALDVGDARIGLAISDPNGVICLPIEALVRCEESDDLAAVINMAEREGAETIVVGLPLSLDGSHGPAARKMRRFTSALRKSAEIPVESYDERFTTTEAEARLRAAGFEPSRDRAKLDSMAAVIILESFLAARANRMGRINQ